jgi:hypothetical protein
MRQLLFSALPHEKFPKTKYTIKEIMQDYQIDQGANS